MGFLSQYSGKEKKQLAGLALWGTGGAAMVIMGLIAIAESGKTVAAISGLLGIFCLITGFATLAVRIFQLIKGNSTDFSIDFIVWIIVGFILKNTSVLSKLGKVIFVILGIFMLIRGIHTLLIANGDRKDGNSYRTRLILSVILIIAGVLVLANAETIFNSLIGVVVGGYLVIHGATMLYEWVGRFKYFRNFRGLDN